AGCPIEPVVAHNAVYVRISAGELHGMARGRHGKGMAMMALRIGRSFPRDAAEDAFRGEIIAEPQKIILAQLIDADDHNQLGSLGGDKRIVPTGLSERYKKQRTKDDKPAHEEAPRRLIYKHRKPAFDFNWPGLFAQCVGRRL